MPYYPQEHYCDRPLPVAHKEANIFSGLAGIEAILIGMAGIRPGIDDVLWIRPQAPAQGTVEILNYRFRDHVFDIYMGDGKCEIIRDGATVYGGKSQSVCALNAR